MMEVASWHEVAAHLSPKGRLASMKKCSPPLLKTHQGPVCWIEGKLPISTRHIAAKEPHPLTSLAYMREAKSWAEGSLIFLGY